MTRITTISGFVRGINSSNAKTLAEAVNTITEKPLAEVEDEAQLNRVLSQKMEKALSSRGVAKEQRRTAFIVAGALLQSEVSAGLHGVLEHLVETLDSPDKTDGLVERVQTFHQGADTHDKSMLNLLQEEVSDSAGSSPVTLFAAGANLAREQDQATYLGWVNPGVALHTIAEDDSVAATFGRDRPPTSGAIRRPSA